MWSTDALQLPILHARRICLQGGEKNNQGDDFVALTARGINGRLTLLSDRICISRKGDKEVSLTQLSSVRLKRATFFTIGHIRLSLIGGQTAKGRLFDIITDEYTVMFTIWQQPRFVLVKYEIEQEIASLKDGGEQSSDAT